MAAEAGTLCARYATFFFRILGPGFLWIWWGCICARITRSCRAHIARAVYSFTRGSTRLYSGFLGSNKVMELECFILGFGASSSGSTMASAFGLSVVVPLTFGSLPFWTSNPNAFCDLFCFAKNSPTWVFLLQRFHRRNCLLFFRQLNTFKNIFILIVFVQIHEKKSYRMFDS